MVLELSTYFLLFFVAIFAGFIDAIAGGGGLLTVPTLTFTGIDPTMILGTNKAQGVTGSFSASLKFVRSKKIKISEVFFALICSFAGGVLGAFTVQGISSDFLKPLILILLIVVAIFSCFLLN